MPTIPKRQLPFPFVLLSDMLVLFFSEHLSHYKRLRGGIEFVNQIPKSPAGKILRKELAVMARKSKL